MTDLDAIRARDANAWAARHHDGWGFSENDRRDLLAEVDRLRAIISDHDDAYRRAVDIEDELNRQIRLRDDNMRLAAFTARTAERARIRAAVEGLHSWGTIHTCWDDHEGDGGTHADGTPCPDDPREVVDRAAVLAVIEGDER